MLKKLATAFSLFATAAFGQSYTTLQWGLDKTATPYNMGINLGGIWYNFATITSGGSVAIPSSNLSFVQSGSGAVSQTVQQKLRLVVNLQDFGGVGDNSTSNNTAFTNAIAAVIAAGGGKIVVPAGKYVISSQQTISSCTAPVFIEGYGPGTTIIRQTSPTSASFIWNCGSSFSHGGGMSNLTLEAGNGYDTSGFAGLGSSGVGIGLIKMVGEGRFTNLAIHNYSYPFVVNGSWDNDIGNSRILFFDGIGFELGMDTSIAAAGGNRIHNMKISNNGFTGTNSGSVGFQIGSTGGEYIHEMEITSTHYGVILQPGVGQSIQYLFMDKIAPDTTESDAWVLNSANGIIFSVDCVECWGAYSGGNGMSLFGPAANYAALNFSSFRARENVYAGISINTTGTGITDLKFTTPEIASNSRGRPNLSSGVELATNVNGVDFVGGLIGNFGSAFSDQAYGIVCSGSNKITVIGTDLTKFGAGKAEYFCGSGNEVTQYRRDAIIPGILTHGSTTIASLPTCSATLLGSVAVVSNGTAYGTGTYGSAVSATGAVTRKVFCTNTAGATTYAWAYN